MTIVANEPQASTAMENQRFNPEHHLKIPPPLSRFIYLDYTKCPLWMISQTVELICSCEDVLQMGLFLICPSCCRIHCRFIFNYHSKTTEEKSIHHLSSFSNFTKSSQMISNRNLDSSTQFYSTVYRSHGFHYSRVSSLIVFFIFFAPTWITFTFFVCRGFPFDRIGWICLF